MRGIGSSDHTTYGWLLAGAILLGAGAGLSLGSGAAHADSTVGGSASDQNGPQRASAQPSVQRSGRGDRGLAIGAKPASSVARVSAAAASKIGGRPKSCATPNSCGFASFSYIGAPQLWTVPSGVQSAWVNATGGSGGQDLLYPYGDRAYPMSGLMDLSTIQQLAIIVGGNGGPATNSGAGGAGGFNGGQPGGSGSLTGGGGGGGGGATTILITEGFKPSGSGYVLVGAGTGGSGGSKNGPGGFGGVVAGGNWPPTPIRLIGDIGDVWPGGSGAAASGVNGGGGGPGGTPGPVDPWPTDPTSGENAGDLTGNAGGGGGGGGYNGGTGGGAGQASADPFATAGAGGGGGAGSSYAGPQMSNVSINLNADPGPGATFEWVEILTTSLGNFRVGQPMNQQLRAVAPGNPSLTWSSNDLPPGLSLSSTGVLSGTPTQLGSYTISVTVTNPGYMSSAIVYATAVCGRNCRQPR